MSSKRLEQIYDQLPTIDCKGKCADHCGVIPLGVDEERYIRERYGADNIPEPDDDLSCSQLTDGGRCSIHPRRPLICRLFGLVKDPKMRCPHGCKPSFWLPEKTARKLMETVIKDTPINEGHQPADSLFHRKVREATNQ